MIFLFGLIRCCSGSLVSGGGLQRNPPNDTSHQPPPRVNTTGIVHHQVVTHNVVTRLRVRE